MTLTKYLSLLCVTFSMLPLHADDTSFGGQGATPFPVDQPDIKMVDEYIVINGKDLNNNEHRGAWDYSCTFTFQNTSDRLLTIRMGFPFPVNNEFDNAVVPVGYPSKKGNALVYGFSATVNQQPISVQHEKIKANEKKGLFYNDAYLWNMSFPPTEKVKIHHSYITGETFDVMGFTWVSYVLKTGGLWKNGTIGRIQLQVTPNTATRLCIELDPGSDYLKPTPDGIIISGSGKDRKYSWDLTNVHPDKDLSLCLQTGRDYIRYKLVYPLVQTDSDVYKKVQQMAPTQLRLLRNSIFAQYGKSFQSPDLQAYFGQQWWYEKNDQYSDKLLTAEDKQALAIIKRLEQNKIKDKH